MRAGLRSCGTTDRGEKLKRLEPIQDDLSQRLRRWADCTADSDNAHELNEAADRIDALQADAERYRWLRVQHWNDASMCVVTNPKHVVRLGTDCPTLARLDEAIDAARRLAKAPQNG